MARKILALVSGAVIAVSMSLGAQAQRTLTIDLIYDPQARINFSGTPAPPITWLDANSYRTTRRGERGVEWVKVDAVSGRATPLFDLFRMENAFAALPGVSRDEAAAVARSNDLTFNALQDTVIATLNSDLYSYNLLAGTAVRLTSAPGEEEEATFSPDGRTVAFVRGNNLFVVDIATQRERALTTDGTNEIFNGKLDWLYQEEIYGRGRFRGYWWSPDSSRIALLQLDERPVPEYTVTDHIPYHPLLEVTDYPKAGDPNPKVRLGIVTTLSPVLSWVDLNDYSNTDFLIVNVAWAPGGADLFFQVQDREQTWLELDSAHVLSGRTRKVIRETTRAWVNENGNPIWLKDGSFLWFSERNGFKHLYHYYAEGTAPRQVTSGRWDVRSFYGVDEATRTAYFSSGARRHIDTDIYRIGLDGTGMTRLSRTEGTHSANFNPSFTMYVDAWSDATTPTQTRLHRADGADVRVIEGNPVSALSQFRLFTPEFVEVQTRDGFTMDGMILKPTNVDPTRRYPVYQLTYAGPTAASVRNRWDGTQFMFHQMLAQHGVVVWVLDNRSAGGKGAESQWPVYGRLGELELRDLEDGITWLRKQPYIDASRIVLSGWSYGGFMTAYALTHSTSWSGGIVGAPVTDWRDYDTVYTERYMKTPQHNPDGYRDTAPRFAAAKLHGRMLLLHGTTDDNVHLQNSVQFAYELQRAGKPFEMMFYPRSRHAFSDPRLNTHLRQTMFDFVMRTVAREPQEVAATAARQSQ
jgi:dipeptidyl-peptidase-4